MKRPGLTTDERERIKALERALSKLLRGITLVPLERAGIVLSLRAIAGLVEVPEPGGTCGQAKGRRGLGLEHGCPKAIPPSLVPHLR
jgi:hypothetical protein